MGVVRTPFVSGTTLNNPLAIGDTSLSSLGLGGLAAIASPDIAKIVLDPSGAAGNPEVVYVTAHTAAATTATISRAAEGSTARAHLVGTPWIVGPTSLDFGWTSTPGTPSAYNPLQEWISVKTQPGLPVAATTAPGANVATLFPMEALFSDCTVTTLSWKIVTQNGNIDVGIYMYDGTTFTRIVSLGSTACPAAGAVSSNITDTVLYKGTRYFFAFAADGTAAFQGYQSPTNVGYGYTKATSFPLPATITSPGSTPSSMIAMMANVSGGVTV